MFPSYPPFIHPASYAPSVAPPAFQNGVPGGAPPLPGTGLYAISGPIPLNVSDLTSHMPLSIQIAHAQEALAATTASIDRITRAYEETRRHALYHDAATMQALALQANQGVNIMPVATPAMGFFQGAGAQAAPAFQATASAVPPTASAQTQPAAPAYLTLQATASAAPPTASAQEAEPAAPAYLTLQATASAAPPTSPAQEAEPAASAHPARRRARPASVASEEDSSPESLKTRISKVLKELNSSAREEDFENPTPLLRRVEKMSSNLQTHYLKGLLNEYIARTQSLTAEDREFHLYSATNWYNAPPGLRMAPGTAPGTDNRHRASLSDQMSAALTRVQALSQQNEEENAAAVLESLRGTKRKNTGQSGTTTHHPTKKPKGPEPDEL